MTDDDVERVAKALALDMYPNTRWPDNERDANSGIDDRQGRAPVSWHFANKCRSQARVAVNLLSGHTPSPPPRKKPDWRDPFCKRRDENVLSNIRDAYFYGFEDALEIVGNTPTPAPKAEPAWKSIEWGKRIDFDTKESMVLVRKISDKLNGVGQPVFRIELAYRTVSHTWLTAASQPVGSFEEWCEIPK